MRQSPQGPGFGHGCRANLRPPCVGAGEAESRQTRPHTFLRGPNYSSSCGGNSVLIHCEKWAALGIPQHHPTAAKARNPEARSAPGGRPHQPGLASPHPRHASCVSRSGGWCIKGAHGDFWRASQTGADPGLRMPALLEAFRGFLAHREREPHRRPSGAYTQRRGAAGACKEPGLNASLSTLSPAAHLRTREPLLTKQLQLPHL